MKPIQHNGMTLIDKATGKPIELWDRRQTHQGDPVMVTGGSVPHKPGSTGRVLVEEHGGTLREFFPGVIGAKWSAEPVDDIPE